MPGKARCPGAARGPEHTIGKGDDDTHFVVAVKNAVRPPSCSGCARSKFCTACGAETCHCLGECVGCAVRSRPDDDGDALTTVAAWLFIALAAGTALFLVGLVLWSWYQGTGR